MPTPAHTNHQTDSPSPLFKIGFNHIVACIVIGILGLLWFIRPFNATAEYGIDTTEEPSPQPNAADLYVAASAKFGARRDNSAPVSWHISRVGDQKEFDTPERFPLTGKLRWVERNKEAFTLLDQAADADYYRPSFRGKPGPYTGPSFIQIEFLSRYAMVRHEALTGQQHHDQAAEKAIDIWKMAIELQTSSSYEWARTGMSIEYKARQALEQNIPHLTGTQARQATARLEKIGQLRPTLEKLAYEEYLKYLYSIEINAARAQGSTTSGYPPLQRDGLGWLWQGVDARRKAREFHTAAQPILALTKTNPSQPVQYPFNSPSQMQSLAHTLYQSHFVYARSVTALQLTVARMAVEAHQKEKGAFPATLQELVPTYLKTLPADAFAEGKPLGYRLESQSYKLWSVGPDFRNNDAKPALKPNREKESQLDTAPASRSDFMANINR